MCQRHAPAALPPGMPHYPLYRRLGGSQVRSEQVRKISPSSGFDPRNVQPVASRYTRNISWGMKVAVRRTDNITTFMCLFIFLKSGNLNLGIPQGLSCPLQGLLYLFTQHVGRCIRPHSRDTVCPGGAPSWSFSFSPDRCRESPS